MLLNQEVNVENLSLFSFICSSPRLFHPSLSSPSPPAAQGMEEKEGRKTSSWRGEGNEEDEVEAREGRLMTEKVLFCENLIFVKSRFLDKMVYVEIHVLKDEYKCHVSFPL